MAKKKPARLPESFSSDERTRLWEICGFFEFIEQLEPIRSRYAESINMVVALTMTEAERELLSEEERRYYCWPLKGSSKNRLPNVSETRKALSRLSRQSSNLRREIENLSNIELSALFKEGLFLLIEREKAKGGCPPGLDSGLLIRIGDCLNFLGQAAEIAATAERLENHCPSDGWQGEFALEAAKSVAEVLRRFRIPVTGTAPNPYHETEGGPFWKTLVIVLNKDNPKKEFETALKLKPQT